jgi:uncharacterized protein YbaP (TraB family)
MNPVPDKETRMAFRFLPRLVLATAALAGLALPALAQSTPAARQYLWEVTSLTNRIYLYGTVHAGKASFFPLPEPVQKAFADSKVLAVEADITDAEAMSKGGSALMFEPPDKLANHVPAPVYERFRKQLERLGVPESQVAHMKPFVAASLLSFAEWGRQGYAANYGVDLQLIGQARKQGKRIVELEGAQAQTELMASLTEKEGQQALEGIVIALESGLSREQVTGLVNAWQSGDPNLLLEVVKAYNERIPGARELEEKFIWSRHEEMARKIEKWLLDGREPVFVAVGALHLAGPRGLVEMMRKRGYIVRQP